MSAKPKPLPAPELESIGVEFLIPYAGNAKLHSDEQVAQIAASIKEFGFNNPILVDGDNGIIAGHGRVMAARKLGMTLVPCIRLQHLNDAQRRAYILADNRLAETGGGWNEELLKAELDRLSQEGFDVSLVGFSSEDIEGLGGDSDDAYTRKVEAPNYEPKGEKPDLSKLYDEERTKKLIERIRKAAIPEEEKAFLMSAAQRHTVFNFENIAEYYAHSNATVQELMEESALVIIDFGKAIELGFVTLSEGIKELYQTDNPDDEE
jgi:ParB-like chromosome segregation protein Spo0J